MESKTNVFIFPMTGDSPAQRTEDIDHYQINVVCEVEEESGELRSHVVKHYDVDSREDAERKSFAVCQVLEIKEPYWLKPTERSKPMQIVPVSETDPSRPIEVVTELIGGDLIIEETNYDGEGHNITVVLGVNDGALQIDCYDRRNQSPLVIRIGEQGASIQDDREMALDFIPMPKKENRIE